MVEKMKQKNKLDLSKYSEKLPLWFHNIDSFGCHCLKWIEFEERIKMSAS